MKTRIVYPQLWLDEKFAECKQSTKLLFCYLINNQYLGLSRYTRISNRQIAFDTGLNTVQIEEGKTELETLRWIFFKDDWMYHNHECAYVDYVRNQKVEASKEKEVKTVPDEIVRYFKDIYLNKIQTQFKQDLNRNHKSEIRNQKHKGIVKGNEFSTVDSLTSEVLKRLAQEMNISVTTASKKKLELEDYCRSTGKKYKDYYSTLRNWIRRDLEAGKITRQTVTNLPDAPEISEEQRQRNLARLQEIKSATGLRML